MADSEVLPTIEELFAAFDADLVVLRDAVTYSDFSTSVLSVHSAIDALSAAVASLADVVVAVYAAVPPPVTEAPVMAAALPASKRELRAT